MGLIHLIWAGVELQWVWFISLINSFHCKSTFDNHQTPSLRRQIFLNSEMLSRRFLLTFMLAPDAPPTDDGLAVGDKIMRNHCGFCDRFRRQHILSALREMHIWRIMTSKCRNSFLRLFISNCWKLLGLWCQWINFPRKYYSIPLNWKVLDGFRNQTYTVDSCWIGMTDNQIGRFS